jgi:hypothetical protein
VVRWEDVRGLALALPEVEEGTAYGNPAFRVRGKLLGGESVREGGALFVRCDRDERPLLIESNPELYYVTPHFESSQFLLVRLDAAEPDDVAERLEDAWLLTAPKRLVAAFVQGR